MLAISVEVEEFSFESRFGGVTVVIIPCLMFLVAGLVRRVFDRGTEQPEAGRGTVRPDVRWLPAARCKRAHELPPRRDP